MRINRKPIKKLSKISKRQIRRLLTTSREPLKKLAGKVIRIILPLTKL